MLANVWETIYALTYDFQYNRTTLLLSVRPSSAKTLIYFIIDDSLAIISTIKLHSPCAS